MNTNVSLARLNPIHRVPLEISRLFTVVLFYFFYCYYFTLLPVFPLPAKKSLSFPPSRWILHNLLHPGGNFEKQIIPDYFLNFVPMSFNITPMLSLLDTCQPRVSLESQQSMVTLSPEYQVRFLGYKRLVLICFYQVLMVSWEP